MKILELENFSIRVNNVNVISSLDLTLMQNSQLFVAGESGTGKTSFLHALNGTQAHSGKLEIFPGKKTVLVEQQHRFRNLSNTSTFYYQQRFNSFDTLDASTVEEELKKHTGLQSEDELPENVLQTLSLLQIPHLLETRLIQLSNGENKRLQLVKALLLEPGLLLLDNPFIGLDVSSRANLAQILSDIAARGVNLIVSGSGAHVPEIFTQVLFLSKNAAPKLFTHEEFKQFHDTKETAPQLHEDPLLDELISPTSESDFEFAVKMVDVNIRYENRQILDNISWEVRRGECWAVSGHNGAGKSALLSLVNADNPQAYANQVYLFDRKRGTGESIWDIKKKIGFVSPELHLYFDGSTTCMEVIASGIFDTIGLFRVLNDKQTELVQRWLQLFQLTAVQNKLFSRVSTSEQRLLLLARALVKDPPMLILDEPCQGLDEAQVIAFRTLVNEIVTRGKKTLLYVSHYKPEIPDCVDHFLLLENGKIIES